MVVIFLFCSEQGNFDFQSVSFSELNIKCPNICSSVDNLDIAIHEIQDIVNTVVSIVN